MTRKPSRQPKLDGLRDRRSMDQYMADMERGRKDEYTFETELQLSLGARALVERAGWDSDGRIVKTEKEIKGLTGEPDFLVTNAETNKSILVEYKGVHKLIDFVSPKVWTVSRLLKSRGIIIFARHMHGDYKVFDPSNYAHMNGVVAEPNGAYGGKMCFFLRKEKLAQLPTFKDIMGLSEYLIRRIT